MSTFGVGGYSEDIGVDLSPETFPDLTLDSIGGGVDLVADIRDAEDYGYARYNTASDVSVILQGFNRGSPAYGSAVSPSNTVTSSSYPEMLHTAEALFPIADYYH
jgi:hypothetical protein